MSSADSRREPNHPTSITDANVRRSLFWRACTFLFDQSTTSFLTPSLIVERDHLSMPHIASAPEGTGRFERALQNFTSRRANQNTAGR